MMREPIRFEPNVPVVASLRFNNGKDVQGRYGDQVLYTVQTADGERVMYVPPIVRTKIEQAGLTAGEWFRIGKFEVRNGQRKGTLEWRIQRLDPEEQAPEVGAKAPAPQQSPHMGAQPQRTTPPPEPANGTPALPAAAAPAPDPALAPRPQTKLEDALKTVVAACHAATLYAKEIGFAIPNFTSEDISKMAMTLTIGARNGGAR